MNDLFYNLFLKEDAPRGDITTRAIFGRKSSRGTSRRATGNLLAKEELVLSGFEVAQNFLKKKFPKLKIQIFVKEGTRVQNKKRIAKISGPIPDLLLAERIVLNILQRLSGITTLTSRFVKIAKPYRVQILDTRKTTPGLREWERMAVRHGGGQNHRNNLSESYMIKDNHIAACGSVLKAIQKVKAHRKKKKTKIIVEVKTLKELREAIREKPDVILLDNMSVTHIKRAVSLRNQLAKKVLLEISGGVTLKNLKKYVRLGIERISIGALTHSARAVDLSLELKKI